MTRAPLPGRTTRSPLRGPRSGRDRRCRRAIDPVRSMSYGASSLRGCHRGPVRHLALIQPGAQMRLGDPAGSRQRTLGVLEALPGEVANSFLDYGHRLVRGLETGRHVADGGARVADEVREGRDVT